MEPRDNDTATPMKQFVPVQIASLLVLESTEMTTPLLLQQNMLKHRGKEFWREKFEHLLIHYWINFLRRTSCSGLLGILECEETRWSNCTWRSKPSHDQYVPKRRIDSSTCWLDNPRRSNCPCSRTMGATCTTSTKIGNGPTRKSVTIDHRDGLADTQLLHQPQQGEGKSRSFEAFSSSWVSR